MKKNPIEEKYFVTTDDGLTLVKEKIEDTSELSLVQYNNQINKNQIKIMIVFFCTICFVGMMIGLASAGQTAQSAKLAEQTMSYKPEIPPYLKVNADDYVTADPDTAPPSASAESAANNTGVTFTGNTAAPPAGFDGNNTQNFYNTYSRAPEAAPTYPVATPSQSDLVPKTQNPTYNFDTGSGITPQKKKSLFIPLETSSFNQQGVAQPAAGSQTGAAVPAPANVTVDQNQLALRSLEMQASTDYQKQNMQKENASFLEEKRNSTGFGSTITDFNYIQYPDSTIIAGTMIPMTLVTGINSDLPGQIIGQVTRDVYDSLSGNYVLIPKGSRVIGSYSSSVAFGQQRALIAWERLTRPDGVSIKFKGFQGTDLQGYAGFSDKVDNHFDQFAASLGISTGVNLLYNTFVTLLSTNDYLKQLSTLTGAQDNAKKGYESLDGLIEKIGNRQPTLIIREGYAGYIFVSQNLFLPPLYYYNYKENTLLNGGY